MSYLDREIASKFTKSVVGMTIILLLSLSVIAMYSSSVLAARQPAKDIRPPSVKITQPLTGSTISSVTIIVKGTASDSSDGSGVSNVQVRVNSGPFVNALPKSSGDWSNWSVSINIFSVGSQVIEAKATDYSGNTKFHSITLTTIDTKPPQLTPPVDMTVEATGSATPVNLGTPTVSDEADQNPSVSNDAPASFPIGITTVVWTATDFSGNFATANQTITVTPALYDDFDGQSDYLLPKGMNSPNGKWITYSTGYGENGVNSDMLYLHPHLVPFTDDNGIYHSSVGPAVRTTEIFQDYRIDIDMRYDQTTRTDTQPKRWEEAVWLLFDHQLDSTHFRYFHVDREGVGIGYYDGGVNPGSQQIINEARNGIQVSRINGTYSTDPVTKALTSYPPHVTQGQWTHIVLEISDETTGSRHIVVTVDGVPVYDFINTTSFSGGVIMIYCEDAWISVDNVHITRI